MAIFTRPINNPFNKPAKSNLELVQEWKNRGLIIDDDNRVLHYLDFISYYRFSAYTIPFQNPSSSDHRFKPNVCFDNILDCYTFDRELRLLIMDAIERIEVAVRTQISNVMSMQAGGAFWYLNPDNFLSSYSYYNFLAKIEKQLAEESSKLASDIHKINQNTSFSLSEKKIKIENEKKQTFLRHYLSQYSEPKLPPSWMMVEILTWGELSNLYQGIRSNTLKKSIVQHLGINAELLTSWLRSLNAIRNFCAHHSRLWNRELGVSIKIPRSPQIRWLTSQPLNINYEKRIYSILVALQTLLYNISPHSQWAKRLQQLMIKYPNIHNNAMGMPNDWYNDPFWQPVLKS